MWSEFGRKNADDNPAFIYFKNSGRIAIVPQSRLREGNANTESLDQAQNPHGFGQMRVAIVGVAGLGKVRCGHMAERTSGVHDFEPVVKPVGAHRRMSSL